MVNNSNNLYNRKFEQITKTLQGAKLLIAMQQLVDTMPSSDPLCRSIITISKTLYGIEPTPITNLKSGNRSISSTIEEGLREE